MSVKAPAILKHYAVPVGTPKTKCRGSTCEKFFYWIRSANGRNMPIDCDHCSDCKHPTDSAPLFGETEAQEGWGVSHFQTCEDVDEFSRRTS